MSAYSKKFTDGMDAVFPGWRKYENSAFLDRFMDDCSENGISYQDVLAAETLGELKLKAKMIKKQHELIRAYRTGVCYLDQDEARKSIGCPRIYAQCSGDKAALDAFTCYGVFHIPDCPKFKTGECWKRFDELGFTLSGEV